MSIKVFAVFDTKAEAFGMPMFMESRGLALRGFADSVAQQGSILSSHPEDFSLYELGEYDPNSGMIKSHDRPVHLFAASSVVNQLAVAREKIRNGAKPEEVLG